MIRINLLQDTMVGTRATGVQSGLTVDHTTAAPREMDEGTLDVGIKIALVLIPIVITVAYRSFEIGVKKSENDTLQSQLNTFQEKMKSFEPGLKDIEKFQEEKHKLDNQLEVIKQISKERLKNVKSMDALQGIIPNKAWLTALRITDNKIELEGVATDDLVIADFMKDLESSIYFTAVTLESSQEVKTNEGAQKAFKIMSGLQNL